MIQRVLNMHKAKTMMHIWWCHEDNPMGDMTAIDGQWQS